MVFGAGIRQSLYMGVVIMTKRQAAVEWMMDNGQWEVGMTFTCDNCGDSGFCRWAYDPYNINGDCPGSK